MDPSNLKEFDPAIFHSDVSKYKKTKRLSQLVNEIIAQGVSGGNL
jgi:hypothetical protein